MASSIMIGLGLGSVGALSEPSWLPLGAHREPYNPLLAASWGSQRSPDGPQKAPTRLRQGSTVAPRESHMGPDSTLELGCGPRAPPVGALLAGRSEALGPGCRGVLFEGLLGRGRGAGGVERTGGGRGSGWGQTEGGRAERDEWQGAWVRPRHRREACARERPQAHSRVVPQADLCVYLRNLDGPQADVYNATHEECTHCVHNAWVYRVLRKGETPIELRKPRGGLDCLSHLEMRAILLEAVAFGNHPQSTSPFLHCTKRLAVARTLRVERASLYSNWLVRWPLKIHGVRYVDLTHRGDAFTYLDDAPADTALVRSALQLVRAYSAKDSEVVVLDSPPLELVEWWSDASRAWLSATSLRDAWAARRAAAAAVAAPAKPRPPAPPEGGASTTGAAASSAVSAATTARWTKILRTPPILLMPLSWGQLSQP